MYRCIVSIFTHHNLVLFKSDPKKGVNATADFLMTVTKDHLLAAACKILGVQSLTSPLQLLSDISTCSYIEQYAYVCGIATAVVEQCTLVDVSFVGGEVDDQNDHIHNYAKVLCHFGWIVGQVTANKYIDVGVCFCHTSKQLDVQSIL